jgi:16S rRNA (adenine1518-N6/adenine1519-N6)-dimethyltransferase
LGGPENLTVVHADALALDLSQWGQAVVAGNLPYYITSPLLRRALALGPLLRRAVFLVQSEVAARLTARPGSRDYGFLTVQTLVAAVPELLFRVPAAAFSPPPKVDSAVVRLTPHDMPTCQDAASRMAFLEFAARCFAHKRKTVRNNLAGFYYKDLLAARPELSMRAEQLSLEQLQALHAFLTCTVE